MKGFVIGATGSGTGKTTISLGIMAWLAARGIRVAPFKVGPDFIDPGLHAKISGSVSYNLDSWMLPADYNRRLFRSKSHGADIAVVEGVMGLFDGYDAQSDIGSTAQMAKWLNLPVLLVVSARGKARSAAAIVKGFETFDPDLKIAGVVFSRAGSRRHYDYLRDAVELNCTTPCLGYLPKNEDIVMPERHLGLVTADEMPISRETLSTLVSLVNDHIDMDRLMKILPETEAVRDGNSDVEPAIETGTPVAAPAPKIAAKVAAKISAKIAVARDKAFCFYYPDNIEILEASGAQIVYFSPLLDEALPLDIDGIYLGGGYPELNAGQLSAKTNLLKEIRKAARDGMPIYGECGGFMYLCRHLTGADGRPTHPMCGIFDFDITMAGRLRSLGYREITLKADTLIGKKGEVIRGHEFHYSSITDAGSSRPEPADVYDVASRAGQDIDLKGYQQGMTLGSYLHVHFGSNPKAARSLVDCCARYRRDRISRDRANQDRIRQASLTRKSGK